MVPRKLVREGGPPSTLSQGPTSVTEEGEGVDGGLGVSRSMGHLEEGKSMCYGKGPQEKGQHLKKPHACPCHGLVAALGGG